MKKFLPIFFPLSIITFFLFFSEPVLALGALTSTNSASGTKLYTYTSECASSPTHSNVHGIIVPNGITSIDKLYIHFHGFGNPSQITMCENHKLCEDAANLAKNGIKAILLSPSMAPPGEKNEYAYTPAELQCYLNEAKNQLKQTLHISNIDNASLVVSGHSAGGGAVRKFLNSYRADTVLLFDACYGYCGDIIKNNNAGKLYLYGGTQEGGTYASSKLTFEMNKNKATLFKTDIAHGDILRKCYLDHIINDLCDGKAQLTGGESTNVQIVPITKLTDDIITKPPVLSINIPGINFSQITAVIKDSGNDSYLYIPWIGQYISAIYKFAMVIASILAVIVIILSGVRMIISAGGEEKNAATKRIIQALIGLFICWGSYAILYNINPDLVEFKSLKVFYVTGDPLGEDEGVAITEGSDVSTGTNVSTDRQAIIPANSNLCLPIQKEDIKTTNGVLTGVHYNSFGDFRGPLKDNSTPNYRCHAGNDIIIQNEAKVVAIDDGVLVAVTGSFSRCTDNDLKIRAKRGKPTTASTEGYAVFIYHDSPTIDMTVNYGEIDYDESKFKPGDKDIRVKKGEYLGTVGYCGMLHMELYKGKYIPKAGTSLYWSVPAEATKGFLIPPADYKTMTTVKRDTAVNLSLKGQFKSNCRNTYIKYANDQILDPQKLIKQLVDNPCTK